MKFYRILILTLCAYALISCGGAEERKAVYLEKAKASIEAGDLEKARIELKNVLQIDPKDADAYYQLGKIYEQKKDYRKAYSHYLKAEELKPELLANQARLGRIYLLLANDKEKAQEKIDLILSKEADNSEGLLLKAAMMLRNDNKAEAKNIARDVINKDPANEEAVAFLATLYINEKNTVDAKKVLEEGLKVNQENERMNRLLALLLINDKDYERAEVIYKNFLERNPDSIASYNNLAAFYHQTDDKIKAEDILRASIENDPKDVERQLTLVKYIREVKGNDEAISEIKSLIAENSGLGKLRSALAELYVMTGDKQSGIDVYKQAIIDFPEELTGVNSRVSLATIYISDKDFEQANSVLEEAIKVSPNDPAANLLIAKLALVNKDIEKAIISLRIVTKETPDNIDAYLLLVNAYNFEDNKEQVVSTLNTAYEHNKANPDALLKLAQYQLKLDIDKAEKIIDDFNALKKSDYAGLSIKAAILNQKKEHKQAHDIAENLMELFPDKANGYLQALPYYSEAKDKESAITLLEKGYLSAKDNRKILSLLTSLQVSDKKFDVVEKRLKSELKSSPDDLEIKFILAKVYIVEKKLNEATSELEDIVVTNPKVDEPYLLLTDLHLNNKDTETAISTLLNGKKNVPTSLKIPLKIATLYEMDGNYDMAIATYRETYESNPENLVVINNLVSLLSDHGSKDDLQQAKTLIGKLEANEQPVFLDTIGWVYFKTGDYNKAIEYLAKVVEKAPKINIFNYHLGMAYKMAGDKAQAKVYLEKSLEESDNFKQKDLAKAALSEL